jgi:hypothetical protein
VGGLSLPLAFSAIFLLVFEKFDVYIIHYENDIFCHYENDVYICNLHFVSAASFILLYICNLYFIYDYMCMAYGFVDYMCCLVAFGMNLHYFC